jgi:hypothetical protein
MGRHFLSCLDGQRSWDVGVYVDLPVLVSTVEEGKELGRSFRVEGIEIDRCYCYISGSFSHFVSIVQFK